MSAPSVIKLLNYLPTEWKDYFIPPQPIPDVKNDPSKVQLSRISHVYYHHPDLDQFTRFAKDFGFVEAHRTDDKIYYRGYGRDQYVYVACKGRAHFGGPAFVAKNEEEFKKAARLPGAEVRSLSSLPGGGQMVVFNRPNGTAFHVLYGQVERIVDTKQPPSEIHETLGPFNGPFEKPRLGESPFSFRRLRSMSDYDQANSSAITTAQRLYTSLVISAMLAKNSTKSSRFTYRTSTLCIPTSSMYPG